MTDLSTLDATAQAELVKKGELQPIELVEAAIERIERVDPELNAVVTPMYELAREVAKKELPDGPFRGVPFLLKDLLAAYAGVRHTGGMKLLENYVATEDAELVKRHKRAGLVIVGRTNTPEIGILPTTEPALFGKCRNPWNPELTTGGSSGGSAAAVAAGLVPFAHANDGGGSIRIPAACCGLFGLKPTRARNSMGPEVGDSRNGIAAEHAVTRSVRDSAILLDATAGYVHGDPYPPPHQARPFADEVNTAPGKLRIAFTNQTPSGAPVHEDCIEACNKSVALCEELGHQVEEASPPVGEPYVLTEAFVTLWSSGVAMGVHAAADKAHGRPPKAGDVEPLTWALVEMGMRYGAHEYLRAVAHLQRITRQVAEFFEKYDVLVTPTLGEPPVPLGTFDSPPEQPLMGFFRAGMFASFTALYNVTGQPAASVPLFETPSGLPVGTQLVARFGDEATLFRLSAQLEAAAPWVGRRPKIHA